MDRCSAWSDSAGSVAGLRRQHGVSGMQVMVYDPYLAETPEDVTVAESLDDLLAARMSCRYTCHSLPRAQGSSTRAASRR